jgi:hypothetical protein
VGDNSLLTGHESDRQRVMMQIVQELCKRPGLNRTGIVTSWPRIQVYWNTVPENKIK